MGLNYWPDEEAVFRKALDLRDACGAQSACGVRRWIGRNNDPSQLFSRVHG